MSLMAGPKEMVLAAVVAAETDCWPAACFRSVDMPAGFQYAKVKRLVLLAAILICSESCLQAASEAAQQTVAARTDSMMYWLSLIAEAPKTLVLAPPVVV